MQKLFKRLVSVFLGTMLITAMCTAAQESLLQIIEKRHDLSLFRMASKMGAADEVFSANKQTPLVGPLLPFTVFAPNNTAMTKAGLTKEALEQLSKEDWDPAKKRSDTIRDFIKQHVCMQATLKKDDLNGSHARFNGENLSMTNGTIKAETTEAKVVEGDISAVNGILHVVDAVLDS